MHPRAVHAEMQASDKAPLHSVICSAASLAPWQPQSTVAARVPYRGTSPLAAAAAHLSAPGQWPCSCPLCCHGEPAWAMKDNMRSGRQSVSMKQGLDPGLTPVPLFSVAASAPLHLHPFLCNSQRLWHPKTPVSRRVWPGVPQRSTCWAFLNQRLAELWQILYISSRDPKCLTRSMP